MTNLSILHFGSPSESNKTGARNKRDSNRDERNPTILFVYNMILYLRDHKNFTELFEIINTFGKVAGYKINIQKSVAFLYTSN
jgi:hypothetical protein